MVKKAGLYELPAWWIMPGKSAMFKVEYDDYVYANSIQRIEPSGDILVSAKGLDTVFRIDRNTGRITWMLGGKFAKATLNRPVNDPRGGFSHPHYARMAGQTLWVLDNANLFRDLPSRAVAYQLNSHPIPNQLVYEFREPNGKQRYALGSIEPLDDNHVIIGWGAVKPADRHLPQRAVSIVRISDHKEVFKVDMSPGWMSYRVKALHR